jgi:hypothetical protein
MQGIFYWVFLAIVFLSCSVSSKQSTCNKFRTGKFLSHSAFDQQTIVERNDTMQVETNDVAGLVMRARIRWTSPCEYQLINPEEKDSTGLFKPMVGGKTITGRILKAEDDYCVYEASMEGVSMRMIDTLKVLK